MRFQLSTVHSLHCSLANFSGEKREHQASRHDHVGIPAQLEHVFVPIRHEERPGALREGHRSSLSGNDLELVCRWLQVGQQLAEETCLLQEELLQLPGASFLYGTLIID